jgi:hypothetical protein
MTKIDKKIVGYSVKDNTIESEPAPAYDVKFMSEAIKRPEILPGSTYKIKTPQSEHALYITINDMVLNQGTTHEERRPSESGRYRWNFNCF